MSGSGVEALPNVREWSGGPPECPQLVVRPSLMSESGKEALMESGCGQEAFPDVWEWSGALSNVRDRSRGPPGCPGVVRKPYPMSAIAQVATRCPGVIKKPSQMSRSGREALPDIRE